MNLIASIWAKRGDEAEGADFAAGNIGAVAREDLASALAAHHEADLSELREKERAHAVEVMMRFYLAARRARPKAARLAGGTAKATYLRARDRLVDAYRAGRAPSYSARQQERDRARARCAIDRPDGPHPSERRWAARRLARLELARTERYGMSLAVELAYVAGV